MSQLNQTSGNLSLQPGILATREELPVFDERIIITQPSTRHDDYPAGRRPIPVSTVDWRSTHLSQFTPVSGLDFLLGVEQLNIQQTVELHDMVAQVESENRYTVKVPQGETLYMACENSTAFQRMCFGSARAFTLTLYDATQQEAMKLVRRLACSNCLFGCYSQEVVVWVPPGDVVGVIRQQWTVLTPRFLVCDGNNTPIYRIDGPAMCSCATYKDAHFSILSADGLTQLGSIRHQWDQLMVGYSLSVNFPGRQVAVWKKALLLATAFLLEYMYFERAKSSRSCKCLC